MERIERLKELLKASPADNFLQHALALEYLKAGQDQLSRQVFEDLLDRDENYVGSYYHLAKLLQRLNFREEAEQCFQKGIRKARELGDDHSLRELQAAYDDFIYS